MTIRVGDVFENVADHPGRSVRVIDLPDRGPFEGMAHVEVLATPRGTIKRYGPGSTMFTTPRALLNPRRYGQFATASI